jgi:hypothetical protein
MNLRRVLPIALVVTLVSALPILAHASPPDPSWIPGIYDDADYDDVVTLVVSGTGHVAPGSLVDLLLPPRFAGRLLQASEAPPAAFGASAVQSRAPPAA